MQRSVRTKKSRIGTIAQHRYECSEESDPARFQRSLFVQHRHSLRLFNANFAGVLAMKNIIVLTTTVLSACGTVTPKQTATPTQAVTPTQSVTSAQEQPIPVAGIAPASDGWADLDAMTFGCPKAGLNAAAREAAKVPSQGRYQFAYFKIISDSHHSSYEVHFKSNYHGEPDLKYCVSIYCQQGWDPKTSKASVSLISNKRPPTQASAVGAAHGADCGDQQTRVKRRLKR